MEKAREFQKKHLFLLYWLCQSLWLVWITINCGKFWKRCAYQTIWPSSWETYMQVRKQQFSCFHLVKAMVFQWSCMDVRVGLRRKLSTEELMLLTVVLEKTLESPLDYKEIQPVHPKGNQSWVFIGRTDVEAQTPILWPPDAKSWLIGKYPDAAKNWGQEEKGMTEDEMVGWHHQLNGHDLGKLRELVMDREAWRAVVRGVTKVRLDWLTELN